MWYITQPTGTDMNRMIFPRLLVENRIEFLKQRYASGINHAHDEHGIHTAPGDIIDHLATHADPTPNKQYTQWIASRYNQGNFRQEDAPRVAEALRSFHAHKNSLPEKDINKYLGLRSVEDAVHPFGNQPVLTNKQQEKDDIQKGLKVLYKDDKYHVNHLKTEAASRALYGGGSRAGRELGTDWCTAVRSQHNMFQTYARSGDLHTIHVKDDTNSPYQVHSSGQFMDRFDQTVSKKAFTKKHPNVAQVLAPREPLFDFEGKYFDKHKTNPKKLTQYARIMPDGAEDKLHDLVKNGTEKQVNAILDHETRITPKILQTVVSNPDKFNATQRELASSHPYADSQVSRSSWETEKNPLHERMSALGILGNNSRTRPSDIQLFRKIKGDPDEMLRCSRVA